MSSLSLRFNLIERAREELAHTSSRTKAAPMKSLPSTPRIFTEHKDSIHVQQPAAKNKKKKKTTKTKPAQEEDEEFAPPIHRRVRSGEMAYRFAPYLPSSLRKSLSTEERRANRVVIHERVGEWRQRLDREIDGYMEEGREVRERMKAQFDTLRKLLPGSDGYDSPCPELIEM
ncbi:hypothetical protein HDU88_005062 [Geranomyces variabilis]|nr:hypothetical protein HDU88_005062 [Geranomyces variabilis]